MQPATEIVTVLVADPDGWHMRPIVEFSALVVESSLSIRVRKPGGEWVRGDSSLSLLALSVKAEETLEIEFPTNVEEHFRQRLISLFGL